LQQKESQQVDKSQRDYSVCETARLVPSQKKDLLDVSRLTDSDKKSLLDREYVEQTKKKHEEQEVMMSIQHKHNFELMKA
jgi:hypothetical protein